MPFFRVTVQRRVSRIVELRQTTTVAIEAVDATAAAAIVRSTACDLEEDNFDDYMTGWADDDASRQASNDEVISEPESIMTVQISLPWRDNWLAAMPPKEVEDAE